MPPGYDLVMRRFRAKCRAHGQSVVAELAGVSVQTTCDVANGRRAPWGKLLEWLGFEMRYARIRKRRHVPVTGSGDNALRRVGAKPQPDDQAARIDPPAAATSALQGTLE